MVRHTIIQIIAIAVVLPGIDGGKVSASSDQRLGRYSCLVQKIHGDDGIGKMWMNARLIYDADRGTLDGSFDPYGELGKNGILLPPKRLFSRLKVVTGPWRGNNLTAIQYDPVGFRGNVRPIVAWLSIDTPTDPVSPNFQFFSNSIRVLATGKCAHGASTPG